MSTKRRASWWQVYVLVPLAIALLLVETRVPLPTGVHEFFEIGIVLLTFVLMVVWIQTHQVELIDEEMERTHRSTLWPDDGREPR